MTIEAELPVDVQVLDHDPDTIWRVGMRLKQRVLGLTWDGWWNVYVSKEAAGVDRLQCEKDPRYAPVADDVYETTIWAALDDARVLGGYGVVLLDEAMQEVRRYTV